MRAQPKAGGLILHKKLHFIKLFWNHPKKDDLAEIIGIFIENDQSGHFDGLFPDFNMSESLKKAGKRDGAGREEKRERNRKARWERKQKNKNRNDGVK